MRKFIVALLKVVIVVGCAFYIYDRLLSFRMSDGEFHFLQNPWPWSIWLLATLSIGIMILNWFLEARKWQVLIKPDHEQQFSKALYSVLIALAGGIVTPGKIGEYGMRSSLVPKDLRWVALGRHWINTYSLTVATNFIAGLPVLYYLTHLPESIITYTWAFAILWIIFLYPSYALLRYGGQWLQRWLPASWADWIHRIPEGSKVSVQLTHEVLGLSMLRYLTFSLGNSFIWYGMGLHTDFWMLFCLHQVIFLAGILIPVASLFSIVVRGGIAIAVAQPLGIPPDGVLVAIFFNWIFQTAIPLIAGLILLIRHPFKTPIS